jgi:hypothetical protein
VLLPFRQDFADVYEAILVRFPQYQAEIDEVFKSHGFYVDNREPFRDWSEGEEVGRAADQARPERRSAGHIPGQNIKVDNQVPYYVVEIAFPDHPQYDYTLRTKNIDGYIYVQIPPEDYGATITLVGEDVQTGRPLSFSSEEYYREREESTERGYFLTHDFQITGPIPSLPELDVPEASGGEPHWLQASEAPLLEDAPSGVPSGATDNEVEKELSPLPEEVSQLFGLPVVAIVAVGAGGAIFCLGTVAIAVFIFGLGRRKVK